MANIGKSIIIKGDLSGDEDLVIDGRVEGRVSLPNNQVTIGGDGKITAEIEAKSIIVIGKTAGDLNASERVEIQATGVVDGDIRSPRLLVQEGAVVNGTIDMSKAASPAAGKREATGGTPRPVEPKAGEPERKSA